MRTFFWCTRFLLLTSIPVLPILLTASITSAQADCVVSAHIIHFSSPNSLYLHADARALFEAVKRGDTDAARHYLEWGVPADVEVHDKGAMERDFKFLTPLRLALLLKHSDVVTLLLECGADVNRVNSLGETLLHHAAGSGNLEISRFLLEHGADVNPVNSLGDTPLHEAAEHGYVELVRFLTEHGASAEVINGSGETPLVRAVNGLYYNSHNHGKEAINFLLELESSSLSPDTMDKWGDLMMFSAACYDLQNLAQFLLDQGHSAGSTELVERGDAALRLLYLTSDNVWLWPDGANSTPFDRLVEWGAVDRGALMSSEQWGRASLSDIWKVFMRFFDDSCTNEYATSKLLVSLVSDHAVLGYEPIRSLLLVHMALFSPAGNIYAKGVLSLIDSFLMYQIVNPFYFRRPVHRAIPVVLGVVPPIYQFSPRWRRP